MTAVCGGGPSGAKSGFARTVTVGAAALAQWFTRAAPRNTGAIIAAALAGLSFDLTDFCTKDPPPDPGVTAQDLAALTGLFSAGSTIAATQKFGTWFASQYWYELCECQGSATPAPPTPSSPGDADTNPNLPTGGTTIPCWNIERSRIANSAATRIQDLTALDLPQTTLVTVTSPVDPAITRAATIPPGTTTVFYGSDSPAFGQASGSLAVTLVLFNSAGQQLQQLVVVDNNGNGFTLPEGPVPIPGTAASWQMLQEGPPDALPGYHYTLHFFCSGAGPNNVQTPCCPPDPSIDQRLKTIYDLVVHIIETGGGTAPPSTYIKGTVHAGLTGEVSLPVSDILGVLVEVTSGIPSRIVIGGNPPYQWDLGFLSILTGDGMIEQRRLTRQHQVWLPQQGPFATVVGVFLNPGVTINLTELLPPL